MAEGQQKPTFDEVFEAEQANLVRAAFLLLRSQALAEEAVQDAFIKLLNRFDNVQSPGGFLYTTTINRCRDLQRRQNKERSILGRLRPVSASGDIAEPLDDMLAGLHDRWREILILRYYIGHSTVEIAQILDMPEGTVRSSTHKALTNYGRKPRMSNDSPIENAETSEFAAVERELSARLAADAQRITPDANMLQNLKGQRSPSWYTRGRLQYVGISVAAALLLLVSVVALRPNQDNPIEASDGASGAYFSSAAQFVNDDGSCVAYLIWLKPDASDQQIALVEYGIRERFDGPVRYVDQDETWEEAQEFFVDEPETLEVLASGVLPTRYEITFDSQDKELSGDERKAWNQMAAVDDVQRPEDGGLTCGDPTSQAESEAGSDAPETVVEAEIPDVGIEVEAPDGDIVSGAPNPVVDDGRVSLDLLAMGAALKAGDLEVIDFDDAVWVVLANNGEELRTEIERPNDPTSWVVNVESDNGVSTIFDVIGSFTKDLSPAVSAAPECEPVVDPASPDEPQGWAYWSDGRGECLDQRTFEIYTNQENTVTGIVVRVPAQ